MGVFSRLTDIIQSNVVAALDRAEDPQKLVRLIIQEMEETLVEVRSISARLIADKKELDRQYTKTHEKQAYWQGKAELAIEKNRDDLARAALIEKKNSETQLVSIKEERSKVEVALANLKQDASKLQEKLEQAKAKQASYEQRNASVNAQLKVKTQLHSENIEKAMARFDDVERRVDYIEAQVEAYEHCETNNLKQAFSSLEQQEDLELELTELKKKVANG